MDFDTRNKLGVNNNTEYSFRISSAKLWQVVLFYWKHPDIGISFAAKLGFISLGLGILSLMITIKGCKI
jgi:hypothetical protein